MPDSKPDPKPADPVPWDAPTQSTPFSELVGLKEESAKYGIPVNDYPWRDPVDSEAWEEIDDLDIE